MPKHYKEMIDEIINKMDESSNAIYKLVDKKISPALSGTQNNNLLLSL